MRNETGAVSGVEKPRGPDVSVVFLLPTAARGNKKLQKNNNNVFSDASWPANTSGKCRKVTTAWKDLRRKHVEGTGSDQECIKF